MCDNKTITTIYLDNPTFSDSLLCTKFCQSTKTKKLVLNYLYCAANINRKYNQSADCQFYKQYMCHKCVNALRCFNLKTQICPNFSFLWSTVAAFFKFLTWLVKWNIKKKQITKLMCIISVSKLFYIDNLIYSLNLFTKYQFMTI